MPGAITSSPSAFIVIPPAAGTVSRPKVVPSVAVPDTASVMSPGSTATPLSMSLSRTEAVVAPSAPLTAPNGSFVASITASTVSVSVALLLLSTESRALEGTVTVAVLVAVCA